MSSSRSNAQDSDDDKTDQQNDSANTASSTGVDPLMTLLMQNLASSGEQSSMLSRTMFQGVVQSLSLIEMDRNLRQRRELMSLSHMLPNHPNSGVISQQTHPVRVGNGTSLTASPPVRGNLFPESCTPMNANDSTPVLAPQEGIATEGACPETSNMDVTKHFIKHHQQNVKDDTASKALSDVVRILTVYGG